MREAAGEQLTPRRAALLLAAGASTRMGSPKALLAWGGSTLLDYALDQYAGARVDNVVVVVGAHREALEPVVTRRAGVTLAVNPDYARGRSSSIAVGASVLAPLLDQGPGRERRFGGEAPSEKGVSPSLGRGSGGGASVIIVQSVDQPCPARVLEQLCSALEDSAADAVIPTFDDRRGHPVRLSGRLLPELLTVDEADKGLRGVMLRHSEATHSVAVDSPDVLRNLNDPGAYSAAYAAAGWR